MWLLGVFHSICNAFTINGGMIPKVDACTDAIKDGVKKVFINNGEVPHALLIELLTDEGLGTMFVE